MARPIRHDFARSRDSKVKQLMKQIVKKAFNACGFEIHRRRMLRMDMFQVLEHVSGLGLKPETVIDVGVGYGTLDLYEAFPYSTHLLIEPLEEFLPALKHICRNFTGEYVLAAANDKPGRVVINVHEFRLCSSILKETEGAHVDGVPRDVPAVTIDNICKERNLEGPYVIKVDVQGAELRVLDGATNVLQDTEVVVLEVHLFQFFSGGPELYDVLSYMKERGFCVYDICGQQYRPLDGAFSSLDVAFVKERGQFRRTHFWSSREQREEITRRLVSLSQSRELN